MAEYQQYELDAGIASDELGQRVKDLLAGSHSVEVLSGGSGRLVVRVWLAAPYDVGDHRRDEG